MAWKKVFRKLGISLATLVVLGGVGELIARLAEPGPFSFFDHNPYRVHPELEHVHEPGFEGRWDGTWYEINSRGMRGPELSEGPGRGEYRVVCVGDSCTFGKGVLEGESWPRQLEGLLNRELSGGAVVANLGVNGYSGRQYCEIFLERGLELAPDLVVVGYNLNDFPNAIRAVDVAVYQERGLRSLIPAGVRDALGRSALYRFARATFYDLRRERDWAAAEAFARGASDTGGDPEVWRRQEDHLRRIVEAARGQGARVAVFLFPYESQVYLDEFDRTPIRLLGELCGRLEIPFVSLEQEFRGRAQTEDPPRELFLRGDRYHPRPEGYGIVAGAVLELVRERGWLPGS